MGIFSQFKSKIIELIETENDGWLEFPLEKIGALLSNYNKSDFIVIAGRKTSGRGYFILYAYVISPLLQYMQAKKRKQEMPLNIVYINTRRSLKTIMERMILNYISALKKGNKLSIYSLYNLEGKGVLRVSKDYSKKITNKIASLFDKLMENGTLSIFSGKRYIDEIESLIASSLVKYGKYDMEESRFIYHEDYADMNTIVVIDDITNIYDSSGKSVMKIDSGITFATMLKSLSKAYNIIIVLTMPSNNQRVGKIRPSIIEAEPYGTYADRCMILHNPVETDTMVSLGHERNLYINEISGICYFRSFYMASNYMGPSGINVPLFLYPENGYFMELPKDGDDLDALDNFISIAKDYKTE